MVTTYDYWFSLGKFKALNGKELSFPENLDFSEDAFAKKKLFFYRLGYLSGTYRDKPTHLQLVNELYAYFLSRHFPQNRIWVSTAGHYSHRVLKRVFKGLGYRVQTKPNCERFYVYPAKA